MSRNKHYNFNDAQMLRAARKLCVYAVEDQEQLAVLRSAWAAPYFDNLAAEIDTAYTAHIGKDYLKDQREASLEVRTLMAGIKDDLAMFKIQLEVDYAGDELAGLLNTLGFKTYYAKARNGQQKATLDLLSQFKQNMTDELKAQLTGKGISSELIDNIMAAQLNLKNADDLQEKLKSGINEPRQAALDTFNGIYDTAIGICKIAHRFYKNDPVRYNHYSFNTLVNELD